MDNPTKSIWKPMEKNDNMLAGSVGLSTILFDRRVHMETVVCAEKDGPHPLLGVAASEILSMASIQTSNLPRIKGNPKMA